MLILPRLRLVVIEVPKTGSQAVRAMLLDEPRQHHPEAGRHATFGRFRDRVAPDLGFLAETLAVVREPVGWLASWYRYRQRDKVAATPESTRGLPFNAFLQAVIAPDPPPYAVVGQQARMVGWQDGAASVDHVFDYGRLDLLVAFLSDRAGRALRLPQRNASAAAADDVVAPETLGALRAARASDFALAAAVAAAGHLRRHGG